VAIAKPHQLALGYTEPQILDLNYNNAFGKNTVAPEILVESSLKYGHSYKVKFGVDTLVQARYDDFGMSYQNYSINIYDKTANDSLVYYEDPDNYVGSNFKYFKWEPTSSMVIEGYEFDTSKELQTSIFDGILLKYRVPAHTAVFDPDNSGWINGISDINIAHPKNVLARKYPFDYDIFFTENADYVGEVNSDRAIFDDNSKPIRNWVLLNYPLPFYAVNRSLQDSLGNPIHTELIVYDLNDNGEFDWLQDRILVGHLNNKSGSRFGNWAGLSFVFDFLDVTSEELLPKAGDIYHVTFKRGFLETDSVTFSINEPQETDKQEIKNGMENIKVVPNPYIMTNSMEVAVGNWDKNQRRQLMFINLPAQCTIKIFMINGVLIDVIAVDNSTSNFQNGWDTNSEANGTAHWDMLTTEGLEIAAGYYLYHVESKLTGEKKMGKFAVIK